MQNFNFLALSLFIFSIITLSSCKNRVIDKLRPETITILTNQEQARCSCLDIYGASFAEKTNKGITYINSLSEHYNLDSLSISETYAIKLELARVMSIVSTVSTCIAQKTPPIDQLNGMIMQEDLKVVLAIDSTMSEQEQLDRMNIPGLELLEEFCPQHTGTIIKFQEFIKIAATLPPELQ